RHGRPLPAARGRPPQRPGLRRPAVGGAAGAAAGRGGRPGGGNARVTGGGGGVVVGIGADGWDGLSPAARRRVEAAEVVRGSARQLGLLPSSVTAERVPWPAPMAPALAGLRTAHQ